MTNQAIINLTVEERSKELNPRQLRTSGFLPITVYGKDMPSMSLQVNTHDFEMAYKANKDATYELALGSKKIQAKVQDVQLNYSTKQTLNVEFTKA